MSVPEDIGRQPIPRQDIAATPNVTPMEMDCGPFGIHSLDSLHVELTSIGGAACQDGLRNSIATQHSADAIMETADIPEWRGGQHSQTGPSLPGAKKKRSKTSKSVGSMASANALDASLNPIDADMPFEALSPPVHERMKKARVEQS